jgi:dTMP kinase
MTAPLAPRSALSLITTGNFARFWWASVVGSTGDWITVFATITLGANIADEAGVLVALVSRILPGLFLSAWVGVISDRVDRRRLVVISDVGRALIVPFLVFATTLPILVVINLLLEFFSLLGQAPRNAMLPSLVRRENLVTANSLMLGATYGTVPLGAGFNWVLSALPAVTLGGLIPEQTSHLALAFGVDALTFLTSAALIATLPAMTTEHAAAIANGDEEAPPRALQDMIEGVKFFWRRKSVRRVIAGMTAALVGGGTMVVLGNSFVDDVLRADDTGFFAVITAMGVGAGAGILVVSLYESRLLRRDLVFATSLLATGVGLAAASLTSTVSGAALWMLVMGFGAGAAYVMGLTHLHEEVTDELRGRVFATLFALMRIGLFASMAMVAPLQLLLSGVGIGRLSDPTRLVLFLGGLVIIVTGVVTLWSLRSLLGRPKLGAEAREIIAQAQQARKASTRRRRRPEEMAEEEDEDE